jgi:hypothetical protein
MGKWAVSPSAFKPHPKREIDGMSFFREDFTSPQDIAEASAHPDGVRVGRVTVRQLQELEVDAQSDPDPDELPGHVIVPGMRFVDKNLQTVEERRTTKNRSLRLARFANENGVYCPPGLSDPPHKAAGL